MLIILDSEPVDVVVRGTTFKMKPLKSEEISECVREARKAGPLGEVLEPTADELNRKFFERSVTGWTGWTCIRKNEREDFPFTPDNLVLAVRSVDSAGAGELAYAAVSTAKFLEQQAVEQGKS